MKKGNVKKKLIRGEAAEIANATGFSLVYVRQVLSGLRKNQIIVETAGVVIEEREQKNRRVRKQVKQLFK